METTDTHNIHVHSTSTYPYHLPTSPYTHLHASPPRLPTWLPTSTHHHPPPHIPTLIIQYLLLWLRGRARAECPGLGRWRFRSLCLRMEGGVTVTGVQLALFIHWKLGGSDSGLGGCSTACVLVSLKTELYNMHVQY